MQINTDRPDGTVLLFTRPTNGVYSLPKVIRLRGKTTIEEIGVAKKDMPNFFVEAITIADGRIHTKLREIIVPPEKRVLNVAIQPGKDAYQPGEKAKVKITLTDLRGEPFVGSAVVAIYDKSLEYISGGSNVADIRSFFWEWRRRHDSQSKASIHRVCGALARPDAARMSNLWMRDANAADQRGHASADWEHINGPWDDEGDSFNWATGESSGGHRGWGHGPGRGGIGFRSAAVTRTKFADTALWVGSLTTAKDGTAKVSLEMPENLTTWRIRVWAMGHGTRVGEGFCDVVTRKDLIVRLEAPRFFVQSDEVVLSAIVHNYLKTRKKVQLALELGGPLSLTVHPSKRFRDGTEARGICQDRQPLLEIPPGGEAIRLARRGARQGRSHNSRQSAYRRRIGRHGADVSLLPPWDAQDGFLLGLDPAGAAKRPVYAERARKAAAKAVAIGSPLVADAGRGDG